MTILSTAEKADIMAKHRLDPKDTGSVEVQVALLTASIKALTEHCNTHQKDNHSRRGLLNQVSKRRRLLNYLRRKSLPRYQALIAALGLRH